jgi:hypothetical protein
MPARVERTALSLLAFLCGLRKAEIDTLTWSAGSLLAREIDLFAAELFLRHSSPQTTALHFLGKKGRLSTGRGALLAASAPPANVMPITPSPAPPAPSTPGLKMRCTAAS